MTETNNKKRPAPSASEEKWDIFLSKNIQWKIDLSQYGIKSNASVSTDKDNNQVRVFVELDNCKNQDITITATIYDTIGLIKASGIIICENVSTFIVDSSTFFLNCPISKIEKIVISGKIQDDED